MNPTVPVQPVNALAAAPGNDNVEIRAKLRFKNDADKTDFQTYIGAGGGSLPWFTPEQYEAVGDGTTDDAGHIQAALDAIGAGVGGVLEISKMYKVGSQLSYNHPNKPLWIRGQGWHTGFKASADFGSIISMLPPAPDGDVGGWATINQGMVSVKFSDFTIYSTVNRTSGFAIEVDHSDGTIIEHIQLGNPAAEMGVGFNHYGGFKLSAQSNCQVRDGCQAYVKMKGLYVDGQLFYDLNFPIWGDNGSVSGDCMFWGSGSDKTMGGANWTAGSYGIHIAGGTGGFRAYGNSNITGFAFGCYIDSSNGSANREMFFNDCFFDRNGDCGLFAEDGSYTSFEAFGCWGAGNGFWTDKTYGYGWHMGASAGSGIAGSVAFTGGFFYANASDSINATGTDSGNFMSVTGAVADSINMLGFTASSVVGGTCPSITGASRVVGVNGSADV